MKNKVTNILMVGVGGQGIILASEIMADVFLDAGYDVKKSEIHGMAQRGKRFHPCSFRRRFFLR